jgi:carbonic anhydrase
MAAANSNASPLLNEIQNYLRVTRDDIRVVSQRSADGLTRTLLVMQILSEEHTMNRLGAMDAADAIPAPYRDTPIGRLIEYHNLERPPDVYTQAQLLIGMCMDHRKHLRIPDNFAYILRAGGANLRYSEFKVSYAIAVGGVRAIALIGHNHCGMVNLIARQEQFVQGLVDAGWEREWAEQHFQHFAPMFEIGNEVDFVLSETKRLRLRYPKSIVAPLLYRIEDNRLYWIRET